MKLSLIRITIFKGLFLGPPELGGVFQSYHWLSPVRITIFRGLYVGPPTWRGFPCLWKVPESYHL